MVPPALEEAQQAALSAAVQELPAKSGIVMANWNWKVVRLFASERFSISLSRSSCLNYLHRLGFAFKRPKKRLLKADAEKREAFVEEYAALAFQSQESGEKIFFADEAHFRADAELRGKWVLRGEPALVDSTSPRYGEKASYYSAVCLETGQVEWMELGGEQQLRNVGSLPGAVEGEAQRSAERDLGQRAGPPGIRGAGMAGQARSEPAAGEPAGIQPGLQTLTRPSGAGRERRPPEICAWGTKELVQERVGNFFDGLAGRKEEVKRRCRTILQSRAEGLPRNPRTDPHHRPYVHPTLALV